MTRLVMVDGTHHDVDLAAHEVMAALIRARRAGPASLELTSRTIVVADVRSVVPDFAAERLGTECEL